MLSKMVSQMKEKGFDVWISDDNGMAIVSMNTSRGSMNVCYVYKSLGVESIKKLDDERKKELARVRNFVSKFKKINGN